MTGLFPMPFFQTLVLTLTLCTAVSAAALEAGDPAPDFALTPAGQPFDPNAGPQPGPGPDPDPQPPNPNNRPDPDPNGGGNEVDFG